MGTTPDTTPLHFEVPEESAGMRLDAALAAMADVPRSQVRRWIEAGCVQLNSSNERRPSQRLATGDEIEASPPEPVVADVAPEAIPLRVLFEDSDLIVVDKAAGMVVHPAPGHGGGTLVNALLHHCGDLAGIGGVLRPGIVHRLDRGTSGVIVAAKTDAAHVALAAQFHDHTIEREYTAFVRALPGAESGVVDQPIGRHPRDRKRMSVRTEVGRDAITHWKVVRRYPRTGLTRLAIHPQTGRTHQIRVHLSSVGMPIFGDPVYGKSRRRVGVPDLDRPALHAATLGFTHPTRREHLRFEAPLPPDLADLERRLANREGS